VTDLTGTRVLVTGADGFIGSHLVERLASDDASVRALCMYNSADWLRDYIAEYHHASHQL